HAAGLDTARPVGQREDLAEPRHPQPRRGQPVTHLPDNLLDTGGLSQPKYLQQLNVTGHRLAPTPRRGSRRPVVGLGAAGARRVVRAWSPPAVRAGVRPGNGSRWWSGAARPG